MEKRIGGKGQAGGFQHGADFQLRGQGVAQAALAVDGFVHFGARLAVFFKLRHKGKHHRQGPPIGGAQQGLQLHAQHAGLVQPHTNGAPA